MRVVWSARAGRRLDAIYQYIAREGSPANAGGLIERLTARTGALAAHPKMGRVVPEYRIENLREVVEEGYRIIYRIVGDDVRILMVRHGAKPLPKRPSSL